MADTTKQRLFFALWPDERVRRELVPLQGVGARNATVVHPEDLHCTLRFLGQVETSLMPELEAAAASIRFSPFVLLLDHLGWWRRPKILYCAPARIPGALARMAGDLDRALQEYCGIAAESRPYRPHVTLLRKVSRPTLERQDAPVVWPVEGFCLVHSASGGKPPRYRVLKKWLADS